MIVTELYRGQGLGNQLWAYAVTRVLAEDRGWAFGVVGRRRFKGRAFIDLDFGVDADGRLHDGPDPDLPTGVRHYYAQRRTLHPVTGADISGFDDDLLTISDDTKIDGNFEDETYIAHRRDEVRAWFTSRLAIDVPEDICAISLRGGEYRYHPDLLLPADYYQQAMANMRERHPGIRFVVVTDDPGLSRRLMPGVPVVSHRRLPDLRRFGIHPPSRAIGGDFTWLQRAPHLILSNSSFSWWGAWTNPGVQTVIAPKYWARHNVSDGYWSTGTSLTRGWLWQGRDGLLQTYEECRDERERYSVDGGGFGG